MSGDVLAPAWTRERSAVLARVAGGLILLSGLYLSYDVSRHLEGSNVYWRFASLVVGPAAVGLLLLAVAERIRPLSVGPAYEYTLRLLGLVCVALACAVAVRIHTADFAGGFWRALQSLLYIAPATLGVLVMLSAGPARRPLGVSSVLGVASGAAAMVGAVALAYQAYDSSARNQLWNTLGELSLPAAFALLLLVACATRRMPPSLAWVAGGLVILAGVALGYRAADVGGRSEVWTFIFGINVLPALGLLIWVCAGVIAKLPARSLAIALAVVGFAFALREWDRTSLYWVFLAAATMRVGIPLLALFALEVDKAGISGDEESVPTPISLQR